MVKHRMSEKTNLDIEYARLLALYESGEISFEQLSVRAKTCSVDLGRF